MKRRTMRLLAHVAALTVCAVSACTAPEPTAVLQQQPSFQAGGEPNEDFPILVTPQTDNAFVAASDGGHFLLATMRYDAATGVGHPGTQLLGPSGRLGPSLDLGTNAGDVGIVAFDGTRFLTVFQSNDSLDLHGQFVDRGGTASGAPFVITTSNDPAASVTVWGLAYGNGAYLVSYTRASDDPDALPSIFARVVSPSGVAGPEIPVASGGVYSFAAFDGNNFAVLSVSASGGARHVDVLFINPSGTVGRAVRLASGSPVHHPVWLAFNGANYLAVWSDRAAPGGANLTAQALAPDGSFVGTATTIPIAANSGHVNTAVASSNGNFLVSFTQGAAGAQNAAGQFFDGGGAPLGGVFTITASGADNPVSTAYVWPMDGDRYLDLVLKKSDPSQPFDLYGRFAIYSP